MKSKKKIVVFIATATIAACMVSAVVSTVIAELMSEMVALENLEEYIAAHDTYAPLTKIEVNWPWYFFGTFWGVFSIFWFFLAKMSMKKLGQGNWLFCLLVPVSYGLLFLDPAAPLFLVVTWLSGFFINRFPQNKKPI